MSRNATELSIGSSITALTYVTDDNPKSVGKLHSPILSPQPLGDDVGLK